MPMDYITRNDLLQIATLVMSINHVLEKDKKKITEQTCN